MSEIAATIDRQEAGLDRPAGREIDYPAASRIGVLLFCVYVVVWYLQIGNRIGFLGAIRFEFIFAAALSMVALMATSKKNLACPLYGYIFLIFVAMAIQLPFSHAPAMSWEVFVDRVVKFAFMGIFIVLFVRNPSALTLFLGAFLLACMKMGQEGLYGKLTGSMMWENQGTMRLHGSTALYRHPNSFSGMALGTVPFILALWPIANRTVRVLLFILFLLSMNIIVFTGSRTGYVGFVILVLYAFWKSRNKQRYLLVAATALILAIPMIPAQYHQRFESIFTQEEKEGRSAVKRLEILEDSWQIFKENPLGVGVAAFPQVRFETFGRTQDTHNLYMQVATNLGVQGLIIFLILVYKAVRMLNSLVRDFRDQAGTLRKRLEEESLPEGRRGPLEKHLKEVDLAAATALAVLLFLVVRLALGLFGHDLYEIYWWFALGLTIALFNMNKVMAEKTRRMAA